MSAVGDTSLTVAYWIPEQERYRGRSWSFVVAVEAVAENVLQITEGYTVEIEGASKPGCVAESMMRVMF